MHSLELCIYYIQVNTLKFLSLSADLTTNKCKVNNEQKFKILHKKSITYHKICRICESMEKINSTRGVGVFHSY